MAKPEKMKAVPKVKSEGDTKKETFAKLLKILKRFEGQASLSATKKAGEIFELYGNIPVMVNDKKVERMYFASAIMQNSYIGFYFFPVYTHPAKFIRMAPELKKCLKGKSCFHIKEWGDGLAKHIENILEIGFKLYIREGWI